MVGELRVYDLALLQDWLDLRWSDPISTLRVELPSMERRERNRELYRVYDEVEEGPPAYGSPRGLEEYRTGAGVIHFLRVVLARYHPEMDEDLAASVALKMTATEYGELIRAVFRPDPIEEVHSWLGIEVDREGTVSMRQAIAEVCMALGKLPSEVYTMTLREFVAVRSGGKPKSHGVVVRPGMDIAAIQRRMRSRMNGED
jgi:hypothetical protein